MSRFEKLEKASILSTGLAFFLTAVRSTLPDDGTRSVEAVLLFFAIVGSLAVALATGWMAYRRYRRMLTLWLAVGSVLILTALTALYIYAMWAAARS